MLRRHAILSTVRNRPDLSAELLLMADDPTARRSRPARRRFNQIVDALEKTGARYALCGAAAVGAHGAVRFTEDLDFFVDAADIDRVLAALTNSLRELTREPPEGAPLQVRLRSKRARTRHGVDVDLMVPCDAVEAWALASSVRARAFDRKVDVVSPEALVLLKLRAAMSQPTSPAGHKHQFDALTLLQTTRIDIAGLRRFVASDAKLAAELERALAAPRPKPRIS
jgi:nucleotidyltransferase AbiEii toxin of type IV toxin-antitoxin system